MPMGVGVSIFPGKKHYGGGSTLLALQGVGGCPISRKRALRDLNALTIRPCPTGIFILFSASFDQLLFKQDTKFGSLLGI